jgi:hypothetical protein
LLTVYLVGQHRAARRAVLQAERAVPQTGTDSVGE